MIVSIIIPIHNRLEVTKQGIYAIKKSLSSIKTNKDLRFEIVIVDDGSTDGSSGWISKNHPDIHLLSGNGNLWWSGAVNMGVQFSLDKLLAQYVIIVNPDNEPDNLYFDKLEGVLKKTPQAIIGSKIVDIHTNREWSGLKYFNPITGLSRNRKSNFYKTYEWVTGMGVIVPASIINTIGLWDDKNYPQYFGDTDFCLRASKENFKVICSNELIIYNKTEYSSYVGENLKTYFKSLNGNNIGSRYNLKTRFNFYKNQCITPIWILTYIGFYIKYTLEVLVKIKNPRKTNF